MTLSKRERLEKTIAGEVTDRVPIALWRHWPGDDQRPVDFVQACVEFQKQWDFDFIKICPAVHYNALDYGLQAEWKGNLEGLYTPIRSIIHRSLDWTELRVLDPRKGQLGQQEEIIRLMKQALKGDLPFIQTIYSPLSQAQQLAGEKLLITHLRTEPERLKTALNILTGNILRFLETLSKSGLAGIYYVIDLATHTHLNQIEYETFGKPYDLQILNALPSNWWFNMIQVRGEQPMLDVFTDYPVQSINWDDQTTKYNLSEGKIKFHRAVCGGLNCNNLHLGTPHGIRDQARQAFDMTNKRRLILATSEAMMITTPLSNIRAARETVELTRI